MLVVVVVVVVIVVVGGGGVVIVVIVVVAAAAATVAAAVAVIVLAIAAALAFVDAQYSINRMRQYGCSNRRPPRQCSAANDKGPSRHALNRRKY